MLKVNFLKRKLKLIQDDLNNLSKLKQFTFSEIAADFYKLSTLERLLERIVMRAIDINEHLISELANGNEEIKSYRDTFLLLADFKIYPSDFAKKIAKSAGLRNAIVHQYDNLDLSLVYSSVKSALSEYLKYCQYILKYIEKH